MTILTLNGNKAQKLINKNFKNEKELQNLFENNLEEIFGIRFLATEYTTTNGGRIDTLGLDDNDAPVIIEFKEGEKDNVLNQGLFYLDWLVDHKGDFENLVRNKLKDTKINWADPRLILVAKSYNEYDKYAVNIISANIELWKYSLYEKGVLLVERIPLTKGGKKPTETTTKKAPYEEYTLEHHIGGKPEKVREMVKLLREEITKIDDQITEKFNKNYIGYSLEKNFAEIVVQTNGIWVHIDTPKKELSDPKNKLIDVTDKGHWATGNWKIRMENTDEIDYIISIIKQSYEKSK